MFTRTAPGIESQVLFYDVDFIIYCEGGRDDGVRSDDDASDDDALDQLFWKKIAAAHGIRAKTKCLGSKSNVLAMHDRIRSNNLCGVAAAIDRDYDDYYFNRIACPKLLITFGYSWESDAIDQVNLDVLVNMFTTSVSLGEAVKDFSRFLCKLDVEAAKAAEIDIAHFQCSHSLFDRRKPVSILRLQHHVAPSINIRLLEDECKRCSQNEGIEFIVTSGLRSFFGKTVAKAIYHWFPFFVSQRTKRFRVDFDSFMATCINTSDFQDSSSLRNQHYANAFSKLVVTL